MFEMPTQAQIDDAMHRARVERARFVRDGMRSISDRIAATFRTLGGRPTERRT